MVEQISKTRRACNKNNIPACPFHLVPKGNMIWVLLLSRIRNLTTVFNFQELLPVLIILSSLYPLRLFFFFFGCNILLSFSCVDTDLMSLYS